jgi:hypothetical protein
VHNLDLMHRAGLILQPSEGRRALPLTTVAEVDQGREGTATMSSALFEEICCCEGHPQLLIFLFEGSVELGNSGRDLPAGKTIEDEDG